jgi:uncharacterized membrane protein YcaP (DUF421 family)
MLAIRLMGKRQISDMQPSELVVTMVISDIASLPMQNTSQPLLSGIIPVLILVSLEIATSVVMMKSRKFRKLICGSAVVIIKDGKLLQSEMKRLRLTTEDLFAQLRQQDIFSIEDVQYCIVETNGTVSAYQKTYARPASCGDLKLDLPQKNPPEILIADGCICPEGLRALGMSQAQLRRLLSRKHLEPEALFLMTADADGNCNFIEKEDPRT